MRVYKPRAINAQTLVDLVASELHQGIERNVVYLLRRWFATHVEERTTRHSPYVVRVVWIAHVSDRRGV